MPPPADDTGYGNTASQKGWTDEADGGPPPLDLSEPIDDGAGDELQLGADQYAEGESPLATKPARGPAGGGDAGSGYAGGAAAAGAGAAGGAAGGGYGGAPAGGAQGSTLFERMANLSRGSSTSDEDEDDEDEDGSGALNIPRFLGRQNNQ